MIYKIMKVTMCFTQHARSYVVVRYSLGGNLHDCDDKPESM